MPATPYAQALVSVNSGAPTAGGLVVAVASTLQLSPASTAGWQSCRWELYAYPPGFTAPAGWTQDDAAGDVTGFPLAYYYAASGGGYSPPIFTLNVWGKCLWRLRVNGAITGNDPTGFLTDMTGGASALSPNSIPDFAEFEQGQFGGWDAQVRAAYRAIDAKLTALGAAGSGSSNTVTPVAISTTTATVAGTPGFIKLTGATGNSTVTLPATGFEVTVWNATAYASTLTNGAGGTGGQITIPAGGSVTVLTTSTGVSYADTVGPP